MTKQEEFRALKFEEAKIEADIDYSLFSAAQCIDSAKKDITKLAAGIKRTEKYLNDLLNQLEYKNNFLNQAYLELTHNELLKNTNKLDTIGARLKYLRESKGLSMNELGKEFNILNISMISRYENNKTFPRGDFLAKYSEYFGVSIDWIVKGEEK